MSSATRVDMGRVSRLVGAIAQKLGGRVGDRAAQAVTNQRIARLGLTPRQQELNWLWAWYRCQHYDTRKCDWNGNEVIDPIEIEAIATKGFLPPGFQSMSTSAMPNKFRKPTAPYALPKVIVDRFSGLLFSERHHPQIRIEGDPLTEDFVGALVEEARLWPLMMLAREYGGAMGTVVIGFQFIDGLPRIEIHDPRWMIPDFEDELELVLKSIEKRHMFTKEILDPRTGIRQPIDFWYRRVITKTSDVLWDPVPVDDGEEPDWENLARKEVVHDFGFCPVRWVQNLPVQDDIDGDPDCQGIYPLIEAIDALMSSGLKGTQANCDPTLVITSVARMDEIIKGSDNALHIPNGDAKYLEITGQGIEIAMSKIEMLRKHALEVAQCVLEHPEQSQRTATEIERAFSSMLAKADVMREQYGERGVKPLILDMIKAIQTLGAGSVQEDGSVLKQTINLPPSVTKNENGVSIQKPRVLGAGPNYSLKLQWPQYFDPTLTDVTAATSAAGNAKMNGLIDDEHATKFVAEYFHIEDAQGMLKKLKSERFEKDAELENMMLGRMPNIRTQELSTQKPEAHEAAIEKDIQSTALNGAQIASLLQILMSVQSGLLSREAAVSVITGAFPMSFSENTAREIINAIDIRPSELQEPPPGGMS